MAWATHDNVPRPAAIVTLGYGDLSEVHAFEIYEEAHGWLTRNNPPNWRSIVDVRVGNGWIWHAAGSESRKDEVAPKAVVRWAPRGEILRNFALFGWLPDAHDFADAKEAEGFKVVLHTVKSWEWNSGMKEKS